jgi:S-adenosylmethionine:tRNA ribosyltransferase-isomerase
MSSFDALLAQYDFQFPSGLIAKEPASPRDSARLFVYDRTKNLITLDTFANLDAYLPENAVIVFNKTKVIPAKMTLKKKTGGTVSALFIEKKDDCFRTLASGSFKSGDALTWNDGHTFTVVERNDQEAILKPSFDITKLHDLLEKYGETPLPPYMKDSPMNEGRRRTEYQTVFAKDNGSVAAPTAGLHITENLIKKLELSGRKILYVTLHVNLGTFAPLREDQWQKKELHSEEYFIDPETVSALNEATKSDRPIIAVGTTSVRTLESASNGKTIVRPQGATTLFMTEDTKPHFVDHLITNFHVPKSSLLMLVSAFTGREQLLELYKRAIDEKFRLFSFGDGMLIL